MNKWFRGLLLSCSRRSRTRNLSFTAAAPPTVVRTVIGAVSGSRTSKSCLMYPPMNPASLAPMCFENFPLTLLIA